MSDREATLDDLVVRATGDETVLEVALRSGIEIPHLCTVPGIASDGSCRLCVVEVGRDADLVAACHTPLRPGMQVRTASPRLRALRRALLEWITQASPRAAAGLPVPGELERLLEAHGLPLSDVSGSWDESHPYLRLDADRCVACARCVHVCRDIQGQDVLALRRREGLELLVGAGDGFEAAGCTACGACAELCPTGAISDRDRLDPTPAERVTRSTCGYCGVGCQVAVVSAGERVLRIDGVREAAVNRGHLCAKGRYAHAHHRHRERLRTPLLRGPNGLMPVSWDEATSWLAERLATIRDREGPQALGVFTSSRSTNEAAYLLQKLFRVQLGTNNVDCCARVCHASTALALQQVTGTGAASASYEDIERATCIVVAGANPTEAHPVVGARLEQRLRAGVPLVVIDPRRIELAERADVHLALRPGTNVALLNGLTKLLIEGGHVALDYAAERLSGLEELACFTAGLDLDEIAAITGVPQGKMERAISLIAASPTLFVHGLGLSELTQGTASVRGLCNLGMLTGSIGRSGAGMLPLRGQNNVQGNADMGATPGAITGYQSVADPAVRARALEVWGAPPPPEPGLTLPAMLDGAAEGRIKVLWIQGEDVVQSDPQESHVRAALERLELLVVQELFLSPTAEYAHLVLPAAGALEQDGTFTNGERRIQRVRRAVAPPGEARPDWEVVRDLATALGEKRAHATPAEVMEEIAQIAPVLFGGVRYERLDGDGLQWPCPQPDHPGTAGVHADGFLRGRGQLSCDAYVPSPESDVEGRPWTLITGRVLHQYNVGSMTRRTPSQQLASADELEIAPEDAAAVGVADGGRVEIESRWGRTEVAVRLSRRVQIGQLFLSFHHPESHANAVTGPYRDESSDCPEYKLTAVTIRAVTTGSMVSTVAG